MSVLIAALGLALSFAGCSNPASDNDAIDETVTTETTTPDDEVVPPHVPTDLETPLTFEAITDGELCVYNPWSTFKYKKNDGDFQTVTCTQAGELLKAVIPVVAGDKISVYADGSENDINDETTVLHLHLEDTEFYIYGNVMSLLDSVNYSTKTDITTPYAFTYLFVEDYEYLKNHPGKNLVLPATTLSEGCYYSMFEGCTGITKAPELPATTLAPYCYNGMFYECESLEKAPVLSATTLVDNCYAGMFCYCTQLNYVKCLATDISATDCTDDWLCNVSDTGTFIKAEGANWPTGDSGIPENWSVPGAYKVMLPAFTNGTVTPDEEFVIPGETVTLTITPSTYYELNFVKVMSETLEELTLSGEGNTRTFTMPESDVVVVATFKLESYAVTFNSNGGSSVTTQKITRGQKASSPATPNRSGYYFMGWYSDSGLNTSFNFNTEITAPITLYAKWDALVTSISVTGALSKKLYFVGDDVDLGGITVTANYTDGKSKTITNYTTNTSTSSVSNGKTLTISYTEHNVTKTTSLENAYYVAASNALTTTPEPISEFEGCSVPGGTFTYMKFGDFPQTLADSSITYSAAPVYNDWYLGSDGFFYAYLQIENSANYYKVEPIKWRVLTNNYENTNHKLLFAENILNVMWYDDNSNNYKESEIRKYLTGEFLNTAFTTAAKEYIPATRIDNSARSANPDSNPNNWGNGENIYADNCGPTDDQIFLLSIQEASRTSYGFPVFNDRTSEVRKRPLSNFAAAKHSYAGGTWWLRSPGNGASDTGRRVDGTNGTAEFDSSVTIKYHGVVPALCIEENFLR